MNLFDFSSWDWLCPNCEYPTTRREAYGEDGTQWEIEECVHCSWAKAEMKQLDLIEIEKGG